MKLIKFTKPGCMPCLHLSRYLERVLPEEYPELEISEIDISMDTDYVVSNWKLRGVPTLILLKYDEEVDRMVGYNTPDDFKRFIAPHMTPVSDR